MLSKFVKDIGKNAPLIGGLLGGPAATKVLPIIASVLGVDNSEQDIAAALQNDPEAYLKLKTAELSHIEILQRIAFEETGAFLADRQSARSREIESVRATGKRDWFLYGLASLVVTGFFGLVGLVIFHPLPKGSELYVGMLFGGLQTGFVAVLSYFFGSSKGSADKNNLLMKNGKEG